MFSRLFWLKWIKKINILSFETSLMLYIALFSAPRPSHELLYISIGRASWYPFSPSGSNNIQQATPCGATFIVSVSFTSKLAFYIHNFGRIKTARKIETLNIFEHLGIGFPRLRSFLFFSRIQHILFFFLLFLFFFVLKWINGIITFSFVTSFFKIKHIHLLQTEFKKKIDLKK